MKNYNQTVCIYLDLLGFSNLTLQSFKTNDHSYFSKLIKIMNREIMETDSSRLNYISFFSDSFIWLFSYNNLSNRKGSATEFDACLAKIEIDLVLLLSDLLENGLIFRGGIAFGRTLFNNPNSNIDEHNYTSENIIFSEALVNAAKIEKCIKYPIIGICNETVDLIYNLDNFGCGTEYVNQFKHIMQPLSQITCKDSDSNIYFLDHLSLITEAIEDARYDFMLRHKKIILDSLQKQTEPKIREKYDFLKNIITIFSIINFVFMMEITKIYMLTDV